MHDTMFNPFAIRPRTESRPSLAGRAWRTLTGVFEALERERKVKLTIDRLRRLPDRTLRDIGVERGQIESKVRDLASRW